MGGRRRRQAEDGREREEDADEGEEMSRPSKRRGVFVKYWIVISNSDTNLGVFCKIYYVKFAPSSWKPTVPGLPSASPAAVHPRQVSSSSRALLMQPPPFTAGDPPLNSNGHLVAAQQRSRLFGVPASHGGRRRRPGLTAHGGSPDVRVGEGADGIRGRLERFICTAGVSPLNLPSALHSIPHQSV